MFFGKNEVRVISSCAENMLDTMVLMSFHAYPNIELRVSRDFCFDKIVDVIGDLGATLDSFSVRLNLVKNSSRFRQSPRRSQVEGSTPRGGNRCLT